MAAMQGLKRFSLRQLMLRVWRWRGHMIRGRVAPAASTQTNLRKTLLQTLAMWTVFLIAGPLVVFFVETVAGAGWRFDFFGRPFYAAALFVAGAAPGSSSAYFMVTRGDGTPLPSDCPRQLVIAGPYKYIRNPMALGSLAQGYAVGLAMGSPLVFLYALAGTLGWNYLVRPWEEWDLEQRFGAEYRRYCDAVRCWLPRLSPYNAP